MVIAPSILYFSLHLLGWFFPAWLWGVDQFHYYPWPLMAGFVGATLLLFFLTLAYQRQADQMLIRSLAYFDHPLCNTPVFKLLLLGAFLVLASAFQVRGHYLGDSAMWFSNMEIIWLDKDPERINWIVGLPLAGFEHIPAHQALDFVLHYQTYRWGHELFGWSPADAYSWLSRAAGVPYVWVVWKICQLVFAAGRQRLTCLVLLLSLGNLQFFFGYGESYTLLSLASALYALYSLRYLRGQAVLAYPIMCFLLATALHIMALSLLPSVLYLLYHSSLGTALRRSRAYLPLLVTGAVAGFYVYLKVYRPRHMPLWSVEEEGLYPILSIPHFLNLANEILLLSPFGLVWGWAQMRRQAHTTVVIFAAWATLGTSALIAVHHIYLGGRDWDIMALPGIFCALWGLLSLAESDRQEHYFSQARLVVVPLMLTHTILWIGINSSTQRAIERLGNLLDHTPNQAWHYQAFTRGHYWLNIRQDQDALAIPHFRTALAYVPATDTLNVARYKTFLTTVLLNTGAAQHQQGDYKLAAEAYQEAIQLRPDYVEAHYNLGLVHTELGDHSRAVEQYQMAIRLDANKAKFHFSLGKAHNRLNQHRKAIEAYQIGLRLDDDAKARYNLGTSYLLLGDRKAALEQYERLKILDPELASRMRQHF